MKTSNFGLKTAGVLTILLLITLILNLILYKLYTPQIELPAEENKDEIEGYGSVSELEDYPILDDFEYPALEDEGMGVDVGYFDNYDIPDTEYFYNTSDGSNSFKLVVKKDLSQSELVVNESVVALGVATAVWSNDNKFIMFSKFEDENPQIQSDFHNTGNIWVVDANGKNLKKIHDATDIDVFSYESNGSKIAFAGTKYVGIVDMDGNNFQKLKEYPIYNPYPGIIAAPSVRQIDDQSFEVFFDSMEGDGSTDIFNY